MRLLFGLQIWLLISFVRSEDDIAENLHIFDGMDATLGLIERNFGDTLVKKFSFALFEGTQNMLHPVEILSKFMQELTPEEMNSISEGIVSSITELAEIVKQPGAVDKLKLFINSTPGLLATLSTIMGGVGHGHSNYDDNKGPVEISNADDEDPFEARKGKMKKSILDFNPTEIDPTDGDEFIELAGDLLKTGASLLGSISSSVAKGSGKKGGGLIGFATKIMERMIEEGLVDDDVFVTDEDAEDDEEDLNAADEEKQESTNLGESQSKSSEDPKIIEKNHVEL